MDYTPLVRFCVEKLVEDSSQVSVEQVQDGDAIQVQVRVAPEDTGKVIGRGGRIVSALRQVVNIAASKNDENVYVKVLAE